VGEDFILTVDANQGYTLRQAVEFSRLVQDQNIRWFE
jgi:D-arabinonate dehydratase